MEKAFGKILLGFDNSEAAMAALQSAYGLSLKFHSQITALVVSGKDTNLEESRKTLDAFAKDKQLSMTILEKQGTVYDEVIKLEKEGDYDVILWVLMAAAAGENYGWEAMLLRWSVVLLVL